MLAPIHIVDEDGNDAAAGRDRHRVLRARRRAGPASSTTRTKRRRARRSTRTAGRRVGDMGYLDDEGYLYLTDRRTFMIVSGGVNIYPQEAENVLINHPKVFDVAVFGIPDPEMGEKVHAVVQPDDVGRRRTRARTRAARVLPRAPRALQVPEGDRLRPRAAAPADRQALQAPAARPLLGQQDVAHRLMAEMEPGRLHRERARRRHLRVRARPRAAPHARRPVARSRSARDGSTSPSTAIPVPRDPRGAAPAAPRS